MPERALRGSLALGSRAESGRGAKGGDDGKQKEKKTERGLPDMEREIQQPNPGLHRSAFCSWFVFW